MYISILATERTVLVHELAYGSIRIWGGSNSTSGASEADFSASEGVFFLFETRLTVYSTAIARNCSYLTCSACYSSLNGSHYNLKKCL